jgi:hypothetical protein
MLKGDPMIFTAKAVCDSGSLDYSMNLEQFEMHELEGSASETKGLNAASLVCYRPQFENEILVYSDQQILDKVFRAELTYFVDCILGRHANDIADTDEALAAVKIVDNCRTSLSTGMAVSIN